MNTEQQALTATFAFIALYLIWKHKLLAWVKDWITQPPKGA